VAAKYASEYQRSITAPEDFWGEQAALIDWEQTWSRVLDDSAAPMYRWFAGGQLNTCYNALDRHIEAGRGDQPALIFDSAMTNTQSVYTYTELRDAVALFAGVLVDCGVVKGDRVIVYMPMVPEAAIAMLACARIGAVHSVVFGGFAANELATRIDDAEPKVIVAASCGLEPGKVVQYKPLLDEAIKQADHKPERCIILQRPEAVAEVTPRDIDWLEALSVAQPQACVTVAATDPLYILYTSGTTGQPKGVVRDNGGHAVALNWSMHAIYGVDAGDVYWAASDVGWVVGHSYIVYAPLLCGCTTLMFEGKPVGTPDAGEFWRVIAEHRVNVMFTAPTAIRAIRREDPNAELMRQHDLSCLRNLFLAGERCDPDTLHWVSEQLGVPVIDHWWQTETGWSIAANPVGLGLAAVPAGSAGLPMPGWDVRIVDEECNELAPGESGAVVCKLPLPPGSLPTLWGADERFRQAYLERFPGFYQSGDAGFVDEDGYLFIMSRTDDVINVAGHRLSTGAIEEVLATHADVAECAVTGIHDELKGQVPLGFLVLKAGVKRSETELACEAVQLVRDQIGPVAAFRNVLIVKRLPKTRSGKVLRRTLRNIVDGEDYVMPATIDDPAILEEITTQLAAAGMTTKQY
jgi:propionyl-CoA synthetase